MAVDELDSIPLAVRVYPEVTNWEKKSKSARPWRRPNAMFVFDTETTTDAIQRLLFGCYRFIVDGNCLEEGLFYANDLPTPELAILRKYVTTHPSDSVPEGVRELRLINLKEFLNKLFLAVYKSRALLVGFNLPFDLSRIAFDVAPARGQFAGGFSLGLWSYIDKKGHERRNGFRPRIAIKHVDGKRALMGFTAQNKPDREDLIPEGSENGKSQAGHIFRGHFLDLKTLAFALTDRGHSLESACNAFGVEHGKVKALDHGRVTADYIDYNRRDVQATSELAEKLLNEFDKHPINLQDTKAFSPASIGKSYLRTMGIKPILQRHSNFQPYIGYAQTAFFGGRTSAHIRNVPVPVVYTDFLSMYPTVNSLLNLWEFVIARNIRIIDHCQHEITDFLRRLTVDDLFKPTTWKNLRAFVRIVPNGDILPTRGMYNSETHDWQVAINYVHASRPEEALWFSLPDIAASVILTGRIPTIIDAFRLEPCGTLRELKETQLRGVIDVDPRNQDFFKSVIEERKRLSSRQGLSEREKERLSKALKVLANSTSYGIYAEMNRQKTDSEVSVRCYGIDATPFTCRVSNPEQPGQYCFPPLASLITGAARLMLALLEKSVSDLGGTYAMEDTDSMAIVATQKGGLVPCCGGPYRMADCSEAVKAVTWREVEQISRRFEALRPYDSTVVPGSILKVEEDNFDPDTGKQRQLWCLAISAKRYALFLQDHEGNPTLLRRNINSKENHWSEHGLGHLLNPTDPESDDREWIAQVWLKIIRNHLNISVKALAFENVPAVGRVTVSSPSILEPLKQLNAGKKYCNQIKPFNFLLSCHINPLGYPMGADPLHFHLISPYETEPRKWLKRKWIDQYTGKEYWISTDRNYSSRQTARVKTYGDVIGDYEFHPESKCADANGKPATRQTKGMLQRRHVRIDQIKYIGKESNNLEEIESGLIHSAKDIYTEYQNLRRDEWETKIRPALKKIPLSVLARETGLSRRMLIDARTGRRRPHLNNQRLIITGLQCLNLSLNNIFRRLLINRKEFNTIPLTQAVESL